jgi:hypothetical protein
MKRCVQCASVINLGESFCRNCGAKQQKLIAGYSLAKILIAAAAILLVMFLILITVTPTTSETPEEAARKNCAYLRRKFEGKPISEWSLDDIGLIRTCEARGY